MANENYAVTLTADSTQYQQSLNASTQSTNALTDALGRAGNAIQSLWQKANRKLTFIAAGEVAAITGATIAAANLEQQMSQLQARQVILNRDTNAYVSTINNLRTGFGQTSTQAIQLVQQMNQLQVPFRQQQATAANYIKMSAATGENVNQLAQSQQMFMRSMQASQNSVQNYSSMMSRLQEVTGASATATLDFANSITPISKTLGLNQQQIAGISAAFTKAGQDGYAAANVYTKMMSDINKAAQYGGPELKVYSDLIGVSVDQFKQMPKAEVITKVFEDLNKQGPQAIKTLEQLGLEGVRSQRAIASVMQQGGIRGAIGTANAGYSDTDTFTKAAEKALSGLNDELAKTRESLTTIAQGFGSMFIPALQGMVQVLNVALTPLEKMANLLIKMPDALKIIGATLATAFVGLNFLPRILAGLASVGWISQGLRGPLSQGVRAGFRPGNLNDVQREFIGGAGAAGPRTLFSMGQFLGRNLNPNTWISRFGGDPERYAGTPGRIADLGRRTAILGTEVGGTLARGVLLPWQRGYRDPSSMHLNKTTGESMLTTAPTWREAFRQWGITAKGKEGDDFVRPLKDQNEAVKESVKQTKAQTEEIKKSRTVLGTFSSELGKTLRAGGSALVGGAGMAGRGLATAGGLLGRFALSSLTALGPLGLTMLAGGAATAWYGARKKDAEAARSDTTDDSAGSTYRDALGIASKQTMSFADVVKNATKSIGDSASTLASSMHVSSADIQRSQQYTDIQDKFLATRPNEQAIGEYVTNLLQTNSDNPAVMQAAKLDLIKLAGASKAQQYLNSAQQNQTTGNLFNLITPQAQGWGSMVGLLSGANRTATQTAADTMRAQYTQASQRSTVAGGQYFQASLNQLAEAGFLSDKGLSAAQRSRYGTGQTQTEDAYTGSAVARARVGSMLNLAGLEDDKKSRKALEQTLNKFGDAANLNWTTAQRQEAWQKALTESMTSGPLKGTAFGDYLASARNQAGGIWSGTSATVSGIPVTDRLAAFGNEDARKQMARSSVFASTFFGSSATPGVAQSTLQALGTEGNVGYNLRASSDILDSAMKRAGGSFDKANAALLELGNEASSTAGNLRELISAAQAELMNQRQFANRIGGRTTLMDLGGQALGDMSTSYAEYQRMLGTHGAADPQTGAAKQQAEDARKQAQTQAEAINDWMQNMFQQYRAFDHQREQGQAQLDRTLARSARDYGIQLAQADEDFSIQRARNEQNYAIQRSRNIADFHTQELRAQADFNRQRDREEQDHQTSLKRMAEDSAKSFYNIYTRVTTQRTWDAANLLQNMGDQQIRLGQQKSDLNTLRKMGLSNSVIQQLGLADPQNAQQLTRLLQGLQEDPSLIGQYNRMTGNRNKAAGTLATDQGNTAYVRQEEDRKKSLKRSADDFDLSMDRQRTDFRKQLNRSSEDFSRAMSQSQSDYDRMRRRQKENLERSWRDMQSDFDYSMDQQLKNINFFAEQTSTTFTAAQKTVESRTSGMTKKQVQDMGDLMDRLTYVTTHSVDDMDTVIAGPYKKWHINPQGKAYTGQNSTQAGAHEAGGSRAPVGGPDTDSASAAVRAEGDAGGGGGPKKVWPVSNHHVGTPWGKRGSWRGSRTLGPGYHSGADFPVGQGTPVHAIEDGTVVSAGWKGAYGNMVNLDHGGGVHTWYAHNSQLKVHRGQQVDAGDVISLSGETGRAFGPHLHLELVVNGKDRDPIPWLKGAASAGGGGRAGGAPDQDEPKPDFASMTKDFEGKIGQMNYLDKNRQQFHSGFYYTKGELAKAISNDFSKQWQAKWGGTDYGNDTGGGGFAGSPSTGGSAGARGVWNALRSGGLTAKQAAGVMGNIQHESGFVWNIVQGGRRSSNPSSTRAGYGLVQWTPGHKLSDILASGHKKNSLENQIWALLHQLAGKGPHAEGRAGKMLRAADTVMAATRAFMLGYERPANQSDSNVRSRNRSSQSWYDKYKGFARGTGSAVPGWAWVGEHGPELMNFRGGEQVMDVKRSMMAAKATQVVRPAGNTVTNNSYDHSLRFEQVTVKADNPRAMVAELEKEARLAALTGVSN